MRLLVGVEFAVAGVKSPRTVAFETESLCERDRADRSTTPQGGD